MTLVCIMMVSCSDNKHNGYEYVDLGLPSGVKWATCNIGATSPEEYGDYFAWGEMMAKMEYTRENNKTYGETISDISCDAQYDAARAQWGGRWRMPMESEMEELLDKCTWIWTIKNDIRGCKVTGPNGNSIFLPAAGCRDGSSLYEAGSYGCYWSSTPDDDDRNYYACSLDFDSSNHDMDYSGRYVGLCVRPVIE